MSARFSLRKRLSSIGYAVNGILFMLRSQHNAWVHLAATILVCLAGLLVGLSSTDWRWLIVAIVLVWIGESINTAFEYLCDVVSPQFHLSVQRAKDIAAGAVLICVIGAVLIGLLVFIPYLAAI